MQEIVSRGYSTQTEFATGANLISLILLSGSDEPLDQWLDKTIWSKFEGDFSKELRHHLSDLVNEELPYKDGRYRLSSVISGFV